jgi:hypothetical protein
VDVVDQRTVVRNLCMPHSPCFHQGSLYVLNSADVSQLKKLNETIATGRTGGILIHPQRERTFESLLHRGWQPLGGRRGHVQKLLGSVFAERSDGAERVRGATEESSPARSPRLDRS